MGRGRPREERGATPETAAKLRYDVIDSLVEAEKRKPGTGLKQYHADAAREIERVYLSLFLATGQQFDRAGGFNSDRCPFARMSDGTARLWETRYKPWADKVGRVATYVFAAKIDNVMPQGAEVEIVKSALECYAQIAGFVSQSKKVA